MQIAAEDLVMLFQVNCFWGNGVALLKANAALGRFVIHAKGSELGGPLQPHMMSTRGFPSRLRLQLSQHIHRKLLKFS